MPVDTPTLAGANTLRPVRHCGALQVSTTVPRPHRCRAPRRNTIANESPPTRKFPRRPQTVRQPPRKIDQHGSPPPHRRGWNGTALKRSMSSNDERHVFQSRAQFFEPTRSARCDCPIPSACRRRARVSAPVSTSLRAVTSATRPKAARRGCGIADHRRAQFEPGISPLSPRTRNSMRNAIAGWAR